MTRSAVIALLSGAAAGSVLAFQSNPQENHVGWVAQVLQRMQAIKPGMTRTGLLTVFTTEGGLSTRLQQTYVSQDCPYFKVDVEFEGNGLAEDGRDLIVKISRPYLEFSHID